MQSSSLYELLHLCTVRVSVLGRAGHGTGFFVAPGRILTCAHVVKAAQPNTDIVEALWDGQPHPARIMQFEPASDLALLQIDLKDHPCVWLSQEDMPFDHLYSYGYPDNHPGGDPATFTLEGKGVNQAGPLKFKAGQVRPGQSGAPILNVRTGHVCGVVQSTRDRASDLGGRAISASTVFQVFPELVAQQRLFHREDQRWTDGLWDYPARTSQGRNRQGMLKKVRTFWITGVLEQSLYNAVLILLGLSEQPEATENPWGLVIQESDRSEQILSPGTTITQVYDHANGELLILGEPGSGKTTLLLELTRELLSRAREGTIPLIPVVFNLSSWGATRQPLGHWLIGELNTKYRVSHALAQSWIKEGQILLLLDGLDEVASSHRAACVEAINSYRREHSFVPVVVCSRQADYFALPTRLQLQSAVMVQPLSREQIETYLLKAGEQIAALRRTLHDDPDLQTLASTPLMLNVLTITYHNSPDQEIVQSGSPETKQEQIFTSYVERVLTRRSTSTRYSREQTIHWLGRLAYHMKRQSQSVFYMEHLQPSWLPGSWIPRIYSWLAIQLPDILIGVLVSLVIIILLNRAISLEVILLGSLLGGILSKKRILLPSIASDNETEDQFPVHFPFQLLLMFLFVFTDGYWFLICCILLLIIFFAVQYDDSQRPTQRVIQNGLVVGLLVGLAFGLHAWQKQLPFFFFTVKLSSALNDGLGFGLAFGLCAGLLSVLLIGEHMTIQSTDRLVWTWRSLGRSLFSKSHLIATMRITILIALLIGLSVGIGNALIQGWTPLNKLSDALYSGLRFGLLSGLSAGLGYWFLFGLLRGISSATIDDQHRVTPNQGIRSSIRNGLLIGLISFLIAGELGFLRFWLSYWLIPDLYFTDLTKGGVSSVLSHGLYDGLSVGLSIGLLVGLLNGGFASLRHLILRLLLWQGMAIPWNYPHFLDYAAERMLLRKVGGGYMFVHRLLLEYFASQVTTVASVPQQQSLPVFTTSLREGISPLKRVDTPQATSNALQSNTAYQEEKASPTALRRKTGFNKGKLFTILLAVVILLLALVFNASIFGLVRPSLQSTTAQIETYKATATAQDRANAIAVVLAKASPIPYPPQHNAPVLDDPLQDNSSGNNWAVSTSKNGFCKFTYEGFDIQASPHFRRWSPARARYFTDFIYEIQMKIIKGDGGGIAFRINPSDAHRFYYFAINQYGTFSVHAVADDHDTLLALGFSPAIHKGLKQTNLFAAVVHGQIIELYANHIRVATVGSSINTYGWVGVIVTGFSHQSEVTFQNAKVWKL